MQIKKILFAIIVVGLVGCGAEEDVGRSYLASAPLKPALACGANKTQFYDGAGNVTCRCNEGFEANAFGACENTWGAVKHAVGLEQDNDGELAHGSHHRQLTFGVPLPERALISKGSEPRCRVMDIQTKELFPADCQALARWYSPGGIVSFKWVRANFTTRFFSQPNRRLQLLFYSSTSKRTLAKGLSPIVTTKAGLLHVNTGALRFDISKSNSIIRNVRFANEAPGFRPLPLEATLSLRDDKGVVYNGKLDSNNPWTVEDNGVYSATIRLKGSYRRWTGTTFNRFVLRIYLSRNQSSFDIEHTIEISSTETQDRSVSGLNLNFFSSNPKLPAKYDKVTMPGRIRGSLTGNHLVADDLVAQVVFKDTDEATSRTPRNGFRANLGASSGFMQLHASGYDVGVALRKPRFEFPKALELRRTKKYGDILSVDLWPTNRNGEELLNDWPAQPGPLDLQNPYLDPNLTGGYYCVDIRERYEDYLWNPSGAPQVEVCRAWTGQGPQDQDSVVDWLGTNQGWPILLGNFHGDMNAFLADCGTAEHEACNSQRRFVLDNTAQMHSTSEGMAKTHYLTVFAQRTKGKTKPELLAPIELATIAKYLDHEPYIRVDQRAMRSAGVFGDYYLGADADARFNDVDEAVNNLVSQGAASDDENHIYGMLRYGNELNGHGHSTAGGIIKQHHPDHDPLSSRGLFNQEAHDILYSAWWLYLRANTGRARAGWDYAQKKCRNLIDLSTMWANQAAPHKIGWQGRHSMLPLSDPASSHTLVSGVQLCHLLTGNRRAREAVISGANAAVLDYYPPAPPERPNGIFTKYHEHVPGRENWFGGALRGHTAMWIALLSAYELNRDPQLAQIIHEFRDTLVAAMALEGNEGGLKSNLWSKNGQLSMSKNIGGYQMNLYIGLDRYQHLFPQRAGEAEYRQAMIGLADERLRNTSEMASITQAMFYGFLADAYHKTGDAAYLALYPGLKQTIASQTPAGESARFAGGATSRYYLPRTVGAYLKAVRHYRQTQGNISETELDSQLLGLYQARLLAGANADQRVEVGYVDAPIALFVDEASDRHFEIEYDLGYLNKHNGGAAMIKILAPDGSTVFCREYCDTDKGNPAPRCMQPAQEQQCPTPDPERVVVECDKTNRAELFFAGGYRTDDRCKLHFQPDGQFGRYQIVIDRLVSVAGQNVPAHKTSNLVWGIQTTLASDQVPFIGGVGYDVNSGPLNIRTNKGHLYIHRPNGVATSLRLKTPNRQAGVYLEDVAGQIGEGASLYKENFGWGGNPAHADLLVPAGEEIAGIWVTHGPLFGLSARAHQVARLEPAPDHQGEATLWINGRRFLDALPLANSGFEQLSNDPASPFVGWQTYQGGCSRFDENGVCTRTNAYLNQPVGAATVNDVNALEGERSMELRTNWGTLRHTLQAARAGEHYIFRAVVRTTDHERCFLQYCGQSLGAIPASDHPQLFESRPVTCADDAAELQLRSYSNAPAQINCAIDAIEVLRVSP
jgi:hypothetical protein